ncbi:uncharacterized protein RHIMIDRAFT_123009 [Rhizopus microsporus ATCC 52813]|uniref:Uncharacterized protein n=1 Tax=Rhizopus microsporus ATCC 52813 TaxID=1340429 RepID=A0A2G4SXZ7_RHIZD|nr:uncharacterized protein RHIMIDRAFT_123009 [Rhizopus microsporus ATCC 52813]PHZ13650.1 hypothetical protein RHIMIDRAFT_123009 [Rhizopus microsporus ATCC 52813]
MKTEGLPSPLQMAQEISSMFLLVFVSLFHSILQILQSNILWDFLLFESFFCSSPFCLQLLQT